MIKQGAQIPTKENLFQSGQSLQSINPDSQADNQQPQNKPSRKPMPPYDLSSKTTTQLNSKQEDSQIKIEMMKDNSKIKLNTFIFGILIILTQIAVCLVYGFRINVPPLDYQVQEWLLTPNISFTPIFLNIVMTFIAIIGIGLLFSFHRKLIWSGLGFNAFIVCLTVEIYFIANNLINRIGINQDSQRHSWWFQIYLWNFETHSTKPTSSIFAISASDYILPFGNTLIGALKCSIANCVAFSAILGRAGLLEAYLVTFFGTIIYQFSRQINSKLGIDYADANNVFTFGGFYGLMLGLALFMKYRKTNTNETKSHPLYTGSLNSTGFSLLGCVLLISLFPIFAIHPTRIQKNYMSRLLNIIPSSIYYAISSSSAMAMATSCLINNKLNIRDLINGTIAGGIAIFCPSFFIVNPTYSMIVGSTAGIVQVLVQNFIEKKIARKYNIINTFSFCLFGVQGLIGSAFASIFRADLKNKNQMAYYKNAYVINSTEPIALGFVSTALGVGLGLIVGTMIYFLSHHKRADHFHDFPYWTDEEETPFLDNQSLDYYEKNRKDKFSPGLLPFL